MRKPRLERSTSHHTNSVATMTITKPQLSWLNCSPNRGEARALRRGPADRLDVVGLLEQLVRTIHDTR
jgi:hypothetical protein